MKIVVIGGCGLIGTRLVNNLKVLGHEVAAIRLMQTISGMVTVVFP